MLQIYDAATLCAAVQVQQKTGIILIAYAIVISIGTTPLLMDIKQRSKFTGILTQLVAAGVFGLLYFAYDTLLSFLTRKRPQWWHMIRDRVPQKAL